MSEYAKLLVSFIEEYEETWGNIQDGEYPPPMTVHAYVRGCMINYFDDALREAIEYVETNGGL